VFFSGLAPPQESVKLAITDNRTLSWNINLKQFLGLVALFALCFVAIYTNSLVIGYVVVTLALCAFFLVVAFDVGVPKAGQPEGGTADSGDR
jgi:hypothetical protein